MNVRPHGCWLLTHSTCLSLTPTSNFRWQVPSALFFFSQPPETGVHRKDRQTGHIRESASPGRDLSGEVWKPGTSSSVLPTVSQGPQPFSTLGTNSSRQLLPFPGPHPPSPPTLPFLSSGTNNLGFNIALQPGKPQLRYNPSVLCSTLRYRSVEEAIETYPGCLVCFQVLKALNVFRHLWKSNHLIHMSEPWTQIGGRPLT